MTFSLHFWIALLGPVHVFPPSFFDALVNLAFSCTHRIVSSVKLDRLAFSHLLWGSVWCATESDEGR